MGIIKLIRVITPKLIPKSSRKSVLFFETIKDMEIQNFKQAIAEMGEEKIIDELNDQSYNNAVVASTKYLDIINAIGYLKLSGLFGIVFILIISIF